METIKLVKPNEKLVYEYPPVKIYYRRIPRSELNQIVRQNTNRRTGDERWDLISDELFRRAIIDWEGFDEPYSPEQIENMPSAIVNDFTKELTEGLGSKAAEQKEAEVKN